MPKGVLWRQADAAVAAFGIRNAAADAEFESIDAIADWATGDEARHAVPAGPPVHAWRRALECLQCLGSR